MKKHRKFQKIQKRATHEKTYRKVFRSGQKFTQRIRPHCLQGFHTSPDVSRNPATISWPHVTSAQNAYRENRLAQLRDKWAVNGRLVRRQSKSRRKNWNSLRPQRIARPDNAKRDHSPISSTIPWPQGRAGHTGRYGRICHHPQPPDTHRD